MSLIQPMFFVIYVWDNQSPKLILIGQEVLPYVEMYNNILYCIYTVCMGWKP